MGLLSLRWIKKGFYFHFSTFLPESGWKWRRGAYGEYVQVNVNVCVCAHWVEQKSADNLSFIVATVSIFRD